MIIRENISFERGQDPKKAMNIGLLGKLSAETNTSIKEIKKILKNSIIEDEEGEMTKFENFESSIHMIWDDPKSWDVERDSNEYKIIEWAHENIQIAFNFVYNIKESLNFERSQNPMDSMGIGRIEERKKKLIDEIIKEDPNNWTGSSVLVDFIVPNRFPIGWDYSKMEETSISDLQHAVDYIEKWRRIQQKRVEAWKIKNDPENIQESMDFERGIKPQKALRVGRYSKFPEYDEYLECHKWAKEYFGKRKVTKIYEGENELQFRIDKRPQEAQFFFKFYTIYLTTEGILAFNDENDFNRNIKGIDDLKSFILGINPSELKENMDFERGKDVKSSMNIGIRTIILSKLKQLFEEEIVKAERRKMCILYSFYPKTREKTYSFCSEFKDKLLWEEIIVRYGLDEYLIFPGEAYPSKNLSGKKTSWVNDFKVKEQYWHIFKDIASGLIDQNLI